MKQDFSPYRTLLEHAARQPDAEALVLDDQIVTYGEFLEHVSGLAGWLLNNGFTPGEVTGLCIRNETRHLVCAMALLCLGTPHISLGSHEAGSTRRKLAEKVAVTQIITEHLEDWMEGRRTLVAPFDKLQSHPPATSSSFVENSLDTICAFQNTSGSTNIPKTFGLRLERFKAISAKYANDPKERRVLRTGSIEFDAHRLNRMGTLLAGNTCVFLRNLNLRNLVAVCEDSEVSTIHMGAYKLTSLIQAESSFSKRLPSFTSVQTGGTRVPGRVRKQLKRALTDNIWVLYATSEVGGISLASPDQHDEFPEGVGFPSEGVTVEIVDANGAGVEPGQIGQIRVRKAGMARAYVAEAGLSNINNGWFYPRDLVSRNNNAPLIFHGRTDDVMILNGINIFPSAIEDTLEGYPEVKEAVAYPIESRVHGEIPVAAIVFREDARERDVSHLMSLCRQTLGIRAPRRIFVVDQIPRNAAGKPLRRDLAES